MPAAQAIISSLYKNGTCPTEILEDGTINYLACSSAFGAVLGTQVSQREREREKRYIYRQ